MNSTLYFIRHARPDETILEEDIRPLTDQGLNSAIELIKWFDDKSIEKIISSPYKRAIQTVSPIAEYFGIEIIQEYDLRERKNTKWFENREEYREYLNNIWLDHNYRLEGEESINELKKRNVQVVEKILKTNKNTIIGTHGSALCSILNHYLGFGFEYFLKIVAKMPFIFIMNIENGKIINWEEQFFEET